MNISVLAYLFCLFLPAKSFSQNNSFHKLNDCPLKVTLQNLDSVSVYSKKSDTHFRNLRITITNTADTSFSFLLMSCAWHGCVRLKPQGLPHFSGCDKNVAKRIILKPNEFYTLDSEFKFFKPKRNRPNWISLGFRVITRMPEATDITENKPEHSRYAIFSDSFKYTDKDFIWSNAIKIIF